MALLGKTPGADDIKVMIDKSTARSDNNPTPIAVFTAASAKTREIGDMDHARLLQSFVYQQSAATSATKSPSANFGLGGTEQVRSTV